MKFPREPHEWTDHREMGHHPIPPLHAHGHLPPHLHGHKHLPPHMRSSKIFLDYDENAIARINQLYGGNTEYVIDEIEASPPECKLTWAIILGISVDLSEYPAEDSPRGRERFDTPFVTEQNAEIIAQVIRCEDDVSIVMHIYNACPPEQAALAIAAATMKQSGEGA